MKRQRSGPDSHAQLKVAGVEEKSEDACRSFAVESCCYQWAVFEVVVSG
jgi:hypothetical protein